MVAMGPAYEVGIEDARWARRVARSMIGRRWPDHADDLESAALVGVVEAERRYVPGPTPFRGFAVHAVRRAVIHELQRVGRRGFSGLSWRSGRVARPRPIAAVADLIVARPADAPPPRPSVMPGVVARAVDGLPPPHRGVIKDLYGIRPGGKVRTRGWAARNRNWPEDRVHRVESEALAMLRERLIGEVEWDEDEGEEGGAA